VNLLGIDSVLKPYPDRIRAWDRIAALMPMDKLDAMIRPARLEDLPDLGAAILKGAVQGRVVVDPNA
jgi:acrylyl-CoA reductase (NADPH)